MFGILEVSMLGTFLIMKGMVMEEKFLQVEKINWMINSTLKMIKISIKNYIVRSGELKKNMVENSR